MIYKPDIKLDPWLSKLLGKNCYNISGSIGAGFSKTFDHNCFYQAKRDIQNIFDISDFIHAGFQIISHDATLILKRQDFHRILNRQSKIAVSLVDSEYTPEKELMKIAQNSFEYDRFHQDPEIPEIMGDEIKNRWLLNFFSGQRGNHLFLAKYNGADAGFLLLILKDDQAIIDLIAVASNARGHGVGQALIVQAIKTLSDKYKEILVGTQLKNYPSINLYRSLGFELMSSSVNLHLHT